MSFDMYVFGSVVRGRLVRLQILICWLYLRANHLMLACLLHGAFMGEM